MVKAIMHEERFRYIACRKWRYFKITLYVLCALLLL